MALTNRDEDMRDQEALTMPEADRRDDERTQELTQEEAELEGQAGKPEEFHESLADDPDQIRNISEE